MKIYEGTDGLRGLVKKLIEVYDFKKVVFEGDNASIDTQNATFQLWVTDELFFKRAIFLIQIVTLAGVT